MRFPLRLARGGRADALRLIDADSRIICTFNTLDDAAAAWILAVLVRAHGELGMASPERNEGPRMGQTVIYNNSGTLVPAVIYSVRTDGSVDLVFFNASGATSVTQKVHDPNLASGRWNWPDTI